MARTICSCGCCVVYFLSIMDIMGGILIAVMQPQQRTKKSSLYDNIFEDYSVVHDRNISLYYIIPGVFSVLLGLLLLYGAIKRHAVCVLVYFIIKTISAVLATGICIYVLIIFEFNWLVAVIFGIYLLIVWLLQLGVYLYYKEVRRDFNPNQV